jgi:starch synthase (maltosyl-transferring)
MSSAAVCVYNLFPRLAGNFTQWRTHILRAAAMGFTHLYVNPFLYPGFSGSLYAIADYNRINPDFLDPESSADPWEQVKEIIDYTHARGMKFVFDLVLNHTAIDHPWTKTHPDWYRKDENDAIQRPFCMDNGEKIVWGDLAELNLEPAPEREALWQFWRDYLGRLIDLGVDGFRCDAAYQVPLEFWVMLIPHCRQQRQDVEFIAETLGCDFALVEKLVECGFDITFNSSKYWDFKEEWALKQNQANAAKGIRSIAFAESHDTTRLAADLEGRVDSVKMHLLFAAIFSSGVMVPLGLENMQQQKVDVVHSRPEDWEENRPNLEDYLAGVLALKKNYRVLHEDSPLEVVAHEGSATALLKHSNDGGQQALILINPDRYNHRDFYCADLQELFGGSGEISDVSPEYALAEVPNVYHYSLRPKQIIILLYQQ